MRFARLRISGQGEVPVVKHANTYYDLRPITTDIDGLFLSNTPGNVTMALNEKLLPIIQADGADYAAPIARPTAIICIGMNYAKHAAETGAQSPTEPIVFFKHPNTLHGPYDDIHIPPGSRATDWEVELGVVLKKDASYLTKSEDPLDYVAGYTLCNDVSERDYQMVKGGQWSRGKCFPGFGPTGPYLVTPDELDGTNLKISTRINGTEVQSSTTRDMIFPVQEIIYRLSQHMTLTAGDLIMTGTPEGVALSGKADYLKPGDVVQMELEGVGTLKQTFIA